MQKKLKAVVVISDLREKINEVCPEGYHFKEILTVNPSENPGHQEEVIALKAVIAFEED